MSETGGLNPDDSRGGARQRHRGKVQRSDRTTHGSILTTETIVRK